jgi:hypothetical protein
MRINLVLMFDIDRKPIFWRDEPPVVDESKIDRNRGSKGSIMELF